MKNDVLFNQEIFVKSYGFLFVAQDMGKNIGKNISKI